MDNKLLDLPLLGNRYALLEILGKGGMSIVYRAKDVMLERQVAIKVLRSDYSETSAFQERFRLEARAAANLTHPNIVTVHDFGFDQNSFFIVMEYVPGTDLKTILRQRHVIPITEAIHLMIQASAGIGYAHRAGLVHCDIKPHNMLVTPDQRLKVADFGIARALSTINPDEHSDIVWGSPFYFSPEQASGLAPSPASDVYSLGVVLYEMVTGVLPFQGTNPEQLAYQHREASPTPPSKIMPEILPALNQIILKVLSKEPANRYRTADQFGRVLLTFLQHPDMQVNYKQLEKQRSKKLHTIFKNRINQKKPDLITPSLNSIPQIASPTLDWGTIVLSMLALIAAGGLIPFWLYIYLTLYPPGH